MSFSCPITNGLPTIWIWPIRCACAWARNRRNRQEANAAVVLIHGKVAFRHLYNRMQHIFVENERLDARMRALVDTFAGFQPLLDACSQAMGYPCALIDEQYRVVCKSPVGSEAASNANHAGPGAEAFEPDVIDLFMTSREYRYMRTSHAVFAMPSAGDLMMKNVFSGGELVGSVAVEHRGDALSARYVRFFLNYLTASRELFVARSTLLHRLARIEELARIDFDSPTDMAYLALSFAMLARW